MKRWLLLFALCGSAFAQTTIYVDFGYTGGSNAGTQAHPYATMGSMWTGVNAALASSPPVTVYFSARQPGSSSAAVTTSPLDMTQCSAPACTNSSTLASNLVFDGIQNYNSGTATVPVWSTNVTPIPCTDLNTGTQVCGYNTAAKLVIQASVPITGPSGSTDFADCEYGFTVQGISFQASGGSAGQSANLTYLGNLLFQYNEVTRISLGSNGPGLYLGPGQHGPCHTGSARPAGTDSGPDNVTIQYNYIHSTWGECIYDGASTSDPFVNGAPSNSQQVEGGSVSGDNLGCGNGCSGNASCTTASSANASICNTGANHLIHGNTVESCAVWNGQGDGMDIKDGHANLVITNNNVYPGKTPTCSPTCSQTPGSDGRGILVESATLIDSNFVQAPQHDGIDLVDSWNTSTGRSAVRVSNNVVVNINGVGNTNCYELEPLNVTGLAQWGNVSFENNTAYSCTDDGISVAAAATGTVLATNGIYQSTAGHSYAIGTASFNNYSSSGSCPNSETGTICSSPLFVSTSAPYLPTNFALQGGSAALTAGTNLFSTFTNDFLGNTRQSSGAWEMGAFTPATTTSTLTMTVNGTGGSVSSSPSGIASCTSTGGTCSASIANGTVTLTATPSAGYLFAGWSICTGLYSAGVPVTCTFTLSANTAIGAVFVPMNPFLPQTWVNNNEGNAAWTYEYQLGASSWITGPPPTCSFSLPYAATFTGLQSAVNALETCRMLTGVGLAMDIPPGLYTTSSANGLVIPETKGSVGANFIVLRSTQNSQLPDGQTVCSHGIQDNLATSTDIGIRNQDCAGDLLSYQLGTTVTTIPAGAFTLANGQATNTSAYNDVQYMWTLETSGVNGSAMTFCNASGTSFAPTCATNISPWKWLIEDLEARMSAGNVSNGIPIAMPDQSTTSSQKGTHIHLRKVWSHGDWCDTCLATGTNAISYAIQLDGCVYCSVVDSQTSEILRPGAECHAINGNGTTYKINHNWLEGCGPGIFAGGYGTAGPHISTWLPFQNVEVRRNRLTYPYAWLGQSPVLAGTNPNYSSQFALLRKNGYENKESLATLVNGNIIENVDNSGAQNGVAFDFNSWNSSSGIPGPNYQSQTTDLTFTNNITRNTCDVWESQGNGGLSGGVTLPSQRFQFANNLHYNASTANPGCSTATNTGISWESVLHRWQGTVTRSALGSATFTANCSVDLGGCIGQIATATVTGCSGSGTLTFSAPNISGGIQATGTYNGSCVTNITNPGSGYTSVTVTSGTGSASATLNASSTAPGTGAAQLDIVAGQPITISQCNGDTNFNVATITKGGFLFPAAIGPTADASTNPASLVVSYPWGAGASDSNGYCMISSFQSMPAQFQFTHNTVITDTTHTLTSSNADSQNAGPNYQQNVFLQNDIMLGGGWFNNPIGEGCNTVNWNYDPLSLTDDHLVWPTRTSTNYTSCLYGVNPAYPVASPVAAFPSTPYCTGSTSTAYTTPGTGCLGFIGAMSASSMPLTLADYHQYALRTDSSFYAGGSADASDGTSQGVNIAALDAAQTLNQYPGGFPDTIFPTTINLQINGSVNINGHVKIP